MPMRDWRRDDKGLPVAYAGARVRWRRHRPERHDSLGEIPQEKAPKLAPDSVYKSLVDFLRGAEN